MSRDILIVEDARDLAQLLSDYLVQAGYQTMVMTEGAGVVEWVRENSPRLILLDLMLPGVDGTEICRQIREFSTVPIIMVTARVEERDRLLGLETGADDYICKPFSPREVVARVKSLLRRSEEFNVVGEEVKTSVLRLDADRLEAYIDKALVPLTVVEYHLLAFMAAHPGRVFSRAQLIEQIYPDKRTVTDRTVDSHVKKIRKKIGEVCDQELIHSVYSAGYKYEEKRSGGDL